jgi:hypothetical protein
VTAVVLTPELSFDYGCSMSELTESDTLSVLCVNTYNLRDGEIYMLAWLWGRVSACV